ncbi:MAG: hypothetical protein ABIZ56_07375, partial [Chthoniobacteraceae bacterium]
MLFDDLLAVLDATPHDAALNMAIDETFLRTATLPTLRIYRWARPAISFGYFGKWSDALAAGPGLDIVRRWTGGGIVPHGHDLTFSIIVPRAHPFFAISPCESYCAIHERIASALGNATLAPAAQPQISLACFQNPVQHDVLIAGRKVVGGAQRRTKYGLLHQGSIQQIEDPARLTAALIRILSAKHASISLPANTATQAAILSREKYATDKWMHRI